VLLLRAGELNFREVPDVTDSVLVTVRAGLADREAKSGELPRGKNNEVLGKRTRNTEVATFDEGASNGKDFIGKKGEVERLGDGRCTLENVQNGTVARLNGHDGSGSSQDARVLDEVRSTQIGADANMLYDPCDGDHGRYISEGSRKVEFATRGWFSAERNDKGLGAKNCEMMKTEE